MRVAAVNIRLDVHASYSKRISEAYVEGPANGHHRPTNIWRSVQRYFCICTFEYSAFVDDVSTFTDHFIYPPISGAQTSVAASSM